MTSRNHRYRTPLLLALTLAALSAGIALRPGPVWAHGNPEVRVEPNPATAGAEVTITGEGFEEQEPISLVLEGVLAETALGTAVTDPEGAFHLTFTLPASVPPGSYRVRAVGEDEVAVADIRVEAAATGAEPAAPHEAAIDFHRLSSSAEVTGFALLAAAIATAGAFLIWFPREARHA